MPIIDLNNTRKSFLPFNFTYLPQYNVVEVQATTSEKAVVISRGLALEKLSNPDLPVEKRKIYQRALEVIQENQ